MNCVKMLPSLLFIVLLITFGNNYVSTINGSDNKPLVQCLLGTVRGNYYNSTNGHKYAAFEGVPYARPPIHKNRFQEPRPIKRWHGILEARFLRTCIQYNHYISPNENRVIGDEDCLYLNIYTPNPTDTALLDVIIFIHGGAFMFGSGHIYGERILMDRDNVVYVSINYRLGPFGFLSTADNTVPGNNGMKDQVLALEWIRDNIVYFGGNPASITLTGMSAGGASVHLHYMSPLSKGLFTRGFSLSGTALNPWVLQENARGKVEKLAALVECDTSATMELIVNCLRSIPAEIITHAMEHFFGFLYNPFSPFGVVIEPIGTKNPFLDEHPYEILSSKNGIDRIQHLPWFTSVVQSEGLYPASEFVSNETYLKILENEWQSGRILAAHVLDFNFTLERSKHSAIASKIKKFYLNDQTISGKTFNQLVQMVSDRLFVSDSGLAARMHARLSTQPVYYYRFNYRGAHSKSEALAKSNKDFGASHGDDTTYVLSSNVDMLSTEMDRDMSKPLVDLWIHYARTGVPMLQNKKWKAVSRNLEDPLNYVEITSIQNITEEQSQNFGNCDFWNSLPLRENHRLFSNEKDEL